MSVAGKHFRNFHVKHLQNKEKGGLGVLREHVGHNEDEGAANEDPGVNSDNEEEDEFKVGKLYLMQFFCCCKISGLIRTHCGIVHPMSSP